jgi:hypothetical protein
MTRTLSWLSAALGIMLVLTCLNTAAVGQLADETVKPFGTRAANDRTVALGGHVVCGDCTLDTVPQGEQQTGGLYELASSLGTVVLRVESVKDNGRWQRISANHRLAAQAADPVLQHLTDAATPGKRFTLNGLLYNDRTLEILDLQFFG